MSLVSGGILQSEFGQMVSSHRGDNGPTIGSHLEIRAILSFSKGSPLPGCITWNALQKPVLL